MDPVQGFRLSPQQKRLWLAQGENPAFRSRCAISLTGELDPVALERAVRDLVGRYEILRTTFERAPGIRLPLQVVADGSAPAWRIVSIPNVFPELTEREVRERLAIQTKQDPACGPVLEATLLVFEPRRHLLVLDLPALCADSWSLGNMVRELAELYAGTLGGSPEEVAQYCQYSAWQNALLEEGTSGGQPSTREPTSAPSPRMPMELEARESEERRPFAPGSLPLAFSSEAATALTEAADDHGAPLQVLLLTAWQALLSRLSGAPEVSVAVTFDNRGVEELRDAVGLFARTIPVPCRFEPALRLAQALGGAQAIWREAAELADETPPEPCPREGRSVDAPIGFDFTEVETARSRRGVTFSIAWQQTCLERCKLRLSWLKSGDRLEAQLDYDPDVFHKADVEVLGGQYMALLEGVCEVPERPLGEVDLLTELEQRELVVELNRTQRFYRRERCLHELFEEQARSAPEAVALVWGGREMSFGELNGRANRLARHLRELGVEAEVRVGVLLERSPELVVALLGALKAGGAYVPLEPSSPRERLAYLVADCGLRLVLTEERLSGGLPEKAERVLLDRDGERIGRREASAPEGVTGPDNLAYVLYTSGSTGRPKGVMVPHRGLVNYVAWAQEAYEVSSGWGAPVHSPLAFDLTVTSLWVPLLAGRRVLLLAEEEGVEALGLALRREGGFSLVKLTPSHLRILAQELPGPALSGRTRALVVGGEALSWESLMPWRAHAPQTRLINEYGPTEAVVGCCTYEAREEGSGALPIGRPIGNVRMYVLDRQLRSVARWESGELCIGGEGLARGYLGRPELTAATFVPDPYGEPGSRLYRTGDLGRFRSDGNLEFLGREDQQVKVRGYRIELGEVEQALAAHPGVAEAAVGVQDEATGDRRLVAYVVGREGAAPGIEELRRHLSEHLPEPMIPSAWVELAALPLTVNGKVDRRALPAPSDRRPDLEHDYLPPRTPVEELLVDVWTRVLGIERIGVRDSFFTLGGDSMRSVQAVALLKERGLGIELQDLFRSPTAEKLAREIEARAALSGAAVPTSAVETQDDLDDLLTQLEGLSEEQARAALREQMLQSEVGETK